MMHGQKNIKLVERLSALECDAVFVVSFTKVT